LEKTFLMKKSSNLVLEAYGKYEKLVPCHVNPGGAMKLAVKTEF
jgi:hypothetical protein